LFRFALALLLVAGLYLFGLGRTGLLGPDEPRYAAIGGAMAGSGDWVTPRLWGEPWFEKPALLYWMTGAGHRLGLAGELAARVPVALLSVAFAAFFFLRVRRDFGEAEAWYASAVLATGAGWLAFSSVAVTDLPLAATLGAALLLAAGRGAWTGAQAAGAGAMLGLAVLAKGLVPLVLFAPVAVLRWGERARLFLCAGAALAVATPWYLACYASNGWPFVEEFFIKHHFARFTSGELLHVQPWWYYVPVLAAGMFPWTPALALIRTGGDARLRFWAGSSAFGLLFFSLSTNKLPGYVLPLTPALAILAGSGIARSERPQGWLLAAAALLLGAPVALGILPAALLEGVTKAGFELRTSALAMIGAGIVLCALLARRRNSVPRGALVALTAAGMAAAVVYAKLEVYPVLDERVSVRSYWRKVAAEIDRYCIGDLRRSWVYGLQYYAGRRLPACTETDSRRAITNAAIDR
jgi:4-amino-4-deoxy-L-arabinose transferase-like glycosyltransferase